MGWTIRSEQPNNGNHLFAYFQYGSATKRVADNELSGGTVNRWHTLAHSPCGIWNGWQCPWVFPWFYCDRHQDNRLQFHDGNRFWHQTESFALCEASQFSSLGQPWWECSGGLVALVMENRDGIRLGKNGGFLKLGTSKNDYSLLQIVNIGWTLLSTLADYLEKIHLW